MTVTNQSVAAVVTPITMLSRRVRSGSRGRQQRARRIARTPRDGFGRLRGETRGAHRDAEGRRAPADIEQTHEPDEVERSLAGQQAPGEGGGEVVRFRFVDGRRIADLHRHDPVAWNSAEELR